MTTHAGIGLDPDGEVDRGQAERGRRGVHRRIVASVDEGAEPRPIAEMRPTSAHPGFIEGKKLLIRHLAAGHDKLAVRTTGDVARDWDVVRFVA